MGRYSRYFVRALLVAAVALGLSSTQAFAGGSVVPPMQKAFDMTYGEWTARWVQFVFGLPEADNPLNDTTGALCGKGQWGPVIFLYGTTGGDPVVRTCTIPGNKGLLIPLVNWFGAAPEDGATPEDVAALLQWVNDLTDVNTLVATIDGVPVQNLQNYRFRTPVFSFTGASPNLFSNACGSPPCYEGFHEQGLAEGYYIMVNPLPPGTHTIHIHGEVPEWGLVYDATYHLTVLPGPRGSSVLRRGIGR
jgi:hypothetical protein